MEFSIPDCIANTLTQVFDRPVQGRVFFEEVVQLIFDRRVTRRTPSRYRTRVIADGVIPSPHVDYKHSRIKQYHNEGRALRTETVVNNTYDFDIGRRLCNLDDLKRIGFAANRRLLRVQRISHDCLIGAQRFGDLHRPRVVDGQRASALRFGAPRAQTLLAALLAFRVLPRNTATVGGAPTRRLKCIRVVGTVIIIHGFLGQLDDDGDGAQAPQEKRMLAEVQARSVDFVVLVRSATYALIATHVMFHR